MSDRDVTPSRVLRLIRSARDGDRYAADTLCRELQPTVNRIAYRYFLPGSEHEDVVQYGMMGVLSGVRTWRDGESEDPFGFLIFCAERMMLTALKTARRYRQQMLNEALSFELPRVSRDTGDDPMTLFDVVEGGKPVDVEAESRERVRQLVTDVRERLTPLERESLLRVVNGEPYHRHHTGSKQMENAVDRARRKLRQAA